MMSLIKTIFPKYQAPSDEIVESIAEMYVPLHLHLFRSSYLSGHQADRYRSSVRGGFSTLPTTAAFLGGIVAQEAIKLVTAQYTPLDNTVIIDLVKSTIEKFKFQCISEEKECGDGSLGLYVYGKGGSLK